MISVRGFNDVEWMVVMNSVLIWPHLRPNFLMIRLPGANFGNVLVITKST